MIKTTEEILKEYYDCLSPYYVLNKWISKGRFVEEVKFMKQMVLDQKPSDNRGLIKWVCMIQYIQG